MLRIDAQPQRHFDRLVELREFHFLQEWNRFLQRIGPRFDRLPRLLDVLSGLLHYSPQSPTAASLFRRAVVFVTNCLWSAGRPRPATTTGRARRPSLHDQNLPNHFNPHRSRRAAHAPDGGVDRSGVQIRHLLLRDVLNLLQSHLADLVFVGRARPLGDAGRALQQYRSRRRLGNKGKRAVAVNRDHDRNNQAFQFFLRRARIELLAELHDVDLRLTERRSNRRRRCGLARRNLQLHRSCSSLCHDAFPVLPVFRGLSLRRRASRVFTKNCYATFSTCPNSNSTGVERPKMVTITFKVSRSSFTSSTTPVNVANGPSPIRTVSPFSNLTLSFGFSRLSATL